MPSLNARHALTNALLALCLIALAPFTCTAQDPPPGQLGEVTIGSRDLHLRFRYCPKGTIRPGDPRKQQSATIGINGFYISETEITQQQFDAVLPGKLAEVKTRAKPTSGHDILSQYFTPDGNYPVFAVSLLECVEFCKALEQLDLESHPLGTVARRFRLPADFEWQYACRAGDPQARPHFNGWPEDWLSLTITDDRGNTVPIARAIEDDWSEISKQPFSGSQEDMFTLMEAWARKPSGPTTGDVWNVFRLCLQEGVGVNLIEGQISMARVYERGSPTGHKNAWQIHHMHDNVGEWTLKANDETELGSLWEQLRNVSDNGPTSVDQLPDIKMLRAGGSFVDSTPAQWWRYTVWKWGEDERLLPRKSWGHAETAAGNRAGFRILMERTLSPNWLANVRRQIIGQMSPDAKLLAELQQLRTDATGLVAPSQAPLLQARIDYYLALASYQNGGNQSAKSSLENSLSALNQNDPYYKHLATALEHEFE
jgi:formylglycine-generating enzyme required for sulfatase activity